MQSGINAVYSIPNLWDISVTTASATGTINPGDWLAYSGQFVISQFSGANPGTAYWKTSGAGVAMEANPVYDPAGRSIQNSSLKIMVEGVMVATAAFSGKANLGLGVYPVATGSGVWTPTGATGVAATWQTAQVVNGSAMSGTASPQAAPVATLIGIQNFANAGTGELILRFQALAADVRG